MTEKNINEWADWLNETRRRLGLSMQELAEMANVSRTTIHRVENKNPEFLKKVSDKTIAKLSTALSGLSNSHMDEKRQIDASPKKSKEVNKAEIIHRASIGDVGQVFSNLVTRDPNKAPEVVAFLGSLNMALSSDDEFFRALTSNVWEQARFQMNELAVGRATFNPNPIINLVTVAVECAKKSIYATSMVSPAAWWFSEEGQIYHQANLQKAIELQKADSIVDFQRIFFISPENGVKDNDHISEVMSEQQKAGIKVWVRNTDLPSWVTKQDVMVIDNRFAVIIAVSRTGQYKPALVSIFRGDVENAMRLFEFLKKDVEPYQPD